MLALILFIIVCVFVFLVMPPKTKNGVRPFSIEFIIFLFGVALIYIALRTTLAEKVTSNVILRIIIKTMLTIAGIGIIVLSFGIGPE